METEKETCTRPKWMTKLLNCSRVGGGISRQNLPAILSELNPGLNVDERVLSLLIKQNDPRDSDVLDFETVTKILFQLMLKQTSAVEDDVSANPNLFSEQNINKSDCSCSVPGSCSAMKITDFIIFPTF